MQPEPTLPSNAVPPAPPAAAVPRRPLATALGVVLLLVVGLGTLAFGGLVLLLGSEVRTGTTESTVVTVTGLFSAGFGLAAFAAAVGLWQGRGWGWVLGVVLALVGLLGVLVSVLSSGAQPPLLIGLGLFGGLLACLLVPGVRGRAGTA